MLSGFRSAHFHHKTADGTRGLCKGERYVACHRLIFITEKVTTAKTTVNCASSKELACRSYFATCYPPAKKSTSSKNSEC